MPPPAAGPQTLTWDGRSPTARRAPDGTYTLALSITDDVTTFTRTATLTLDTTAPRITVLSYRNLRFRVSEPATLTLVVGTQRYTRVLKKAGDDAVLAEDEAVVRTGSSATDAAGNTAAVRYRR